MSRGRYIQRRKGIRCRFWLAVGCFAVHALSYLLMPFSASTPEGGEARGLLLLAGCAFWIPLLAGYGLVIAANAERKAFIRSRLDGDVSMHCRAGILTFFSNPPAVIVDAALLAGVAGLGILSFRGELNRPISYGLLAVVSFSLNTHGLFNGRIYKITKFKQTRRVKDHE